DRCDPSPARKGWSIYVIEKFVIEKLRESVSAWHGTCSGPGSERRRTSRSGGDCATPARTAQGISGQCAARDWQRHGRGEHELERLCRGRHLVHLGKRLVDYSHCQLHDNPKLLFFILGGH